MKELTKVPWIALQHQTPILLNLRIIYIFQKMNKINLLAVLVLLSYSASAELWYDSDTSDGLHWGSRIPVVLNESLGLERVNEPIHVELGDLSFSSIRVVDPGSLSDEPFEVGGNDIPFQINGDELLFLGSVKSRGEKTYYIYLSDDPIEKRTYPPSDLLVYTGRYGFSVENSKALWEVSERGYHFSVSRYENRDFNGSITRAQGLDWGERVTSSTGWQGFPAYGVNWNCSVLDSGPIRLRINCSAESFSHNFSRVYSFFSENIFFEVEESFGVLDFIEEGDARLQLRNRVAPFFNDTNIYTFRRYFGDDGFYLVARDVNSTGRFVFFVMGRGDFSDVEFRKHRDLDSFDYVLSSSNGSGSGVVRFLFREGGVIESQREFDRFTKPLAVVRHRENNIIQIQEIQPYDRFYNEGSFVYVSLEADQVYGSEEVSCRIRDVSFPLFDDGSHGDLHPLDNVWTNNMGFPITEETPTGEYSILCEAVDRKSNTVSDSRSFPLFDRGSYHNVVFSAEDIRIRPSGSARIYVNVSNSGNFSERGVFFDVPDLPSGWDLRVPDGFSLDVGEAKRVFLEVRASPDAGLGSLSLSVVTRSRDSIEYIRRVSVEVDLFEVELSSDLSNNRLTLWLMGDDGNPVSDAIVVVTRDNVSSFYRTGSDGSVSLSPVGEGFLGVSLNESGYVPLSVVLGLRVREVSYWFPISAFIIILLTLFLFRLYWKAPDRDFMEDAFVVALVIGVFLTLTWVGFTMRGKEPFTALYFPEDSYSNVLVGDSSSFRYVVDCWEHEPTSYNLSVFLGYNLVDVDEFWLGVGDSLEVRSLEREKTVVVPENVRLPVRVRLVLAGGNRTYDIHYFLRERFSNVSNESAENMSCLNGLLDGGEVDIDCGGPCPPCEVGSACISHLNCLSGFCLRRACSTPTCFDGVLNQGESGIDCGGSCLPCHCFNNVPDLDESDVDCGGSCSPCVLDLSCLFDSDCLSGFCFNGLCRTPTCRDEILNQGEVGTDCGGPCRPCPSCFDGIRNRDEVDVDCGGSCLPCDVLYENRTHVSWIASVDGFISSVRFSPDGSFIAVASNGLDGYVSLFDSTGISRFKSRVFAALTDVGFFDGRFVSPYPKADVHLFDFDGVERMPEFVDVFCDVVSVEERVCDMGSVCGVSRGSDVFLGFNRSENRWVFVVQPEVYRVAFTGNCSHSVVGQRVGENLSSVQLYSGSVSLWTRSLDGDVYSVAVADNGSFVVVGAGGRRISDGNFVYLFDKGGRLVWKFRTDWNIYSLSISDNVSFVFAGSRSGVVYLFDKGGSLVWSFDSGGIVLDLELSSDGKRGIFGNADGDLFYVVNPLVNCSDYIQNMGESDIDCGGPCLPCRVGMWCRRRSDCLSGFCFNGLCRTPTCNDGIRNQNEEGIDCGGPCLPCRPLCFRDGDCGRDFVSDPYCFDDFVLRDRVSFSCVNPGVVESYCEVFNDTQVVEVCFDSECVDGGCV